MHSQTMHAIARRPLWVRVGAGILSTFLFLTNTVYPWISLLPAPPIVVAQESVATATDSAEATPAASVATPAPLPLDPLDQLENEILLSTTSAETVPPEETPESTPSASSTLIPEPSPEDQISTPSAIPNSTPAPPSPTNSPSTTPTVSADVQTNRTTDPLPPPLDPFLISLKYPFVGTYPISYKYGEVSGSSYVRLMQSIFDVDAHDGIDFAIPERTSVLSTGPGEVAFAGNGLYGITVIIKHSWGSSYYGHLSQTSVTVGDKVTTGQEIGLSGSTGVSTAPHLHFGIRPNHYDPYNGYRGMIDPLPYLTGSVLGISTTRADLIHLPRTTFSIGEPSISIPLIASDSSSLSYTLTNPKGEITRIYPTIYSYGTGDTLILARPYPFIPGKYTLTVESSLGERDIESFSWGVLALNSNSALYKVGDSAQLSLAVLDDSGKMVCDANLTLTVRSPSATTTLTTTNGGIILNENVCASYALTLSPDYTVTLPDLELGNYSLTLTAEFDESSYTITDSFTVSDAPAYSLKRLSATRLYPLHNYPMIFRLESPSAQNLTLKDYLPEGFSSSPLTSAELAHWLPSRENNSQFIESNSLSWDLNLEANTPYYFGYFFDAPDESPRLYSLGPATLSSGDNTVLTEERSWSLAVDALSPVVGFFSPPATWTGVGNSNITLTYPDPRTNDLMVAIVAVRPSTVTIDTPSGWTLLDSRTGTDGGAEGADTGSVGVYWFSKIADGTEGTGTLSFTKTGTASVINGQIMQARSSTGTYDVSASGYSISGDATNWGGTLSSDIGLLAGDLVLMSGVQNGDLSASSAWGVSATGITAVSATNNEHGEFGSTIGNQMEIGLSAQLIWEGSNTATPTVAVTQSVAASGVVQAVRIRQGSGTRRTDTWVRSAGRQVAGSTSVVVGYPEHDPGDLLVLYVGSRASTDPTPTTPTGWISLGSYNGGAGSFAADAGNARITAFYRTAETRYTANLTVTTNSANTALGQIVAVHRDSAGSWSLDSDGGTDTSAGVGWSVSGGGIDLSNASGGDLLLVASSINTDAYTYTGHALSASGITFGDVTQTGEFRSGTGNDMSLVLATGRITGGSGSPAPTFTMTANSSGTNAPAGSSLFLKINAGDQTTPDTAVGFFSPERVWTAAGNAALNLVQPDPRAGDLMIATIAIRPSTSTVDTPSGWTLLDSRTGTDGAAEGADTGSVGLYTFYKVATGSEGTNTQQFTETGTTSVWMGSIMQIRSETGAYNLDSAGYSLNGDTTNWNGTLDSDPGLTQGDLVITWAAQNGNPSNTSNWDLQAGGISQKSTTNEHGEFTTNTGNDLEIGLANALIWEGTNTTTPDVVLTQSAAASGAVTVIRVRQGSGTVRSDTWVRSAGVQVVGSNSVTVPYPDHNIGDLIVLLVGSRGSGDPTPDTPYGWTSLGTYNGGVGTFAADAGNSRINAYYRQAESRLWATQTVTISSGNTAIGQMVSLHKDNLGSWTLDSDGGTDTSAGTGWSVTGSSLDLSSSSGGDIVLVASSINTDAYTFSSHGLTASGITFGDVNQTAEYRSTTGNQMDLVVSTGRVTGGSSSPAPTFTMTASGSTANAPAGSSLFVKIVAQNPGISVAGTASGNDTATVKVAINNAIQDESATVSSGTWEITNVPTPSAGDIITVWVDNVSDANESTAVTKYSSSNVSGMVLNTNILTLGSDQDQSLSLTNLNSYDCTEDEDIMHQAASDHLKVEGDSCAGSTTNSYSSEGLVISSGDTLTVGATETVTTYDLTISGTITSTSTATYNVAHNWSNSGTFTSSSSTVNLTGTSGTTQTISGDTSFYNLSATNSGGAGGDWYNASWQYRIQLTVDATKVTADLTDFPLYVDLSTLPSAFHSHVNQTDGRDIRVTKGDGTTELPREVVFYDSSTDTGELHVQYTGTLSSSTDTDLYLYYGNSGASDYAVTDTYGAENVWSSNYVAVYHLTESSGTHYDSTDNSNDSTSVDNLTQQGAAIGKLGRADEFNGTSSEISLPAIALGGNDGTIQIWAKTDVTSYPRNAIGRYYEQQAIRIEGPTQKISTYFDPAGGASYYNTIDTTDWHHLAATYDGSLGSNNIVLYYDGTSQATSNGTGNITNETEIWKIGESSGGSSNDYWDGKIDEVRLSTTALDSTWISTEYNNQNDPNTFYSAIGSEEILGGDRTLSFTAGTTQTVTGTLTVTGSTDNLVILASTTTSSWTINPTAAAVSYVDVSYSTNSGTSFCATNSVNSGNNTGWNITSGASCNTAPNSPTSLAQKTTTDTVLTTGAWHNSTSVKFTVTADDPDNPDTLSLCVEADQLGTSFSNTEDSCGSGVAYSGTGVTLSHTLTLTDALEYHWQVRIKDSAGAYSSWVSYGANAESARDVGIDTTAPTGGTVYDGSSVGVDASFATSSLSSLSANWGSFNHNISGLARYDYSIGTTAGATDVKTWTDNSTATSVTASSLTLQTSQLYYFNIRAVDNAGNTSSVVSSNGALISPSLSFSLSTTNLTFENLSAGNSYEDTAMTTLTTSTNAYNGYVIRAFITDLLKNPGATQSIPHFTGGTYASPAAWGSNTGFGYTSSDTTIQGSNKFAGGTLYAPFSTTGPGDIVADHTSTVQGTSIANETFDITYRVRVPSTQAATSYNTTVLYTATAQY